MIAGDRCGMRAYSLPLRNAALGYLRLAGHGMPEPFAEAARGVAGAMQQAPEMVAGPGSFDSLANALPHVVAKRGALGVFCCASAETGRGGALKIEDGSFEAMEIAALVTARSGRRPTGRGLRRLARASRSATATARPSGSGPGPCQCYSPGRNPPLMPVFPLLVEN